MAESAPHGYEPVGRGVGKKSDWCGRWMALMLCDNFDGHKFYGDGKVVVMNKHTFCNDAHCMTCFIRGYSVREARSIATRLKMGENLGFGKPEHVVVSVSPEDRVKPFDYFLEKALRSAKEFGVTGGVWVFHGFRINGLEGVLDFGAHFHLGAFLEPDGFDHCRFCRHQKGDCDDCFWFKGREIRGVAKGNYLVKVMSRRRTDTMFGTMLYALHHSTLRVSPFKRFKSVDWFGCCAKRKFKSPKPVALDVCPVCGEDMERCVCRSGKKVVKDLTDPEYKRWWVDDPEGYEKIGGGRD